MIGEIITVNGIEYKSVKSSSYESCDGCFARGKYLCSRFVNCIPDKTIYKRHYRLKSTEARQTGDIASDNDKNVTL